MMGELKSLLILLLFLCIEIGILALLVIGLIGQKIFYFFEDKKMRKRKSKISKKIIEYSENPQKFIPDRIFSYSSELLPIMENFNYRLKEGDWDGLKKEIVTRYLLQKGRKRAKSFFWEKRNFAARVFALMPLPEDEQAILTLSRDSVFLVRSVASIAAIGLGNKKGIEQVLASMANEHGYARCFYLDHLLQASVKVLTYIGELALNSKDLKTRFASLEIFAKKTVACPIPSLQRDLQSDDPKLREMALKVLVRNPQKDSEKLLLNYLEDAHEAIRAEAACGLSLFINAGVLLKLQQALRDPCWRVRLQAASSLKKMGEEGIAILKKQDPKSEKTSYEVAQYALDFLD